MRLGFGGAYDPNRFERVSTLVAAYIQRSQGEFDEAHPPPPATKSWLARRLALVEACTLGEGAGQAAPRYLQVYIDDFTCVAPADRVQTPPELEQVGIEAVHTRAGGGEPAAPGTRVYVHAQLAVAGLAA
eukprot:6198814-Pleurochrysis_carterae.AAC.1